MIKTKNLSQSDEFDAIIDNLKVLQISENKIQNQETFSRILSNIDQHFDSILAKKHISNIQTNITIICNKIITLVNLPDKKDLICNHIINFNKTMNILIRAQKIQYIEFKSDLTPFFINCCLQALNEPSENSIFKQNMNLFFSTLFTNDHFTFQFFNDLLYQTFFYNFLPICGNVSLLDEIFNMIINLPNENSFKDEDANLIFQSAKNLFHEFEIKPEVTELFVLSISKLFYRMSSVNSNCTQSFLDNNLPQIIDEKLKSEEKWKDAFSILLSSRSSVEISAPNEAIFKYLFTLLQSKQTKPFKLLFIFKKLYFYKCDQCIDKYFPQIQKLLDFLSEIIDSIIQLNLTDILTNLLQSTFRMFTVQMNDNVLQYSQLISIIEKSAIKFDAQPSKFLKCFLRTPSPSTLNTLFNNDFFLETSLHYFSLPIMKETQPTTFQYLYELNDKKQKILVKFLTINPNKRLVRCLMNCILSNPSENGFLIIMTSFHDSEEFCEKFVDCDGLQFLEKCFQNGFLSLDMFSMIISTLVSHRLFIEVDKFIAKLDRNHPLFSLSHKQLENIVYGGNSGRFRPLRVPSLFYLLQDKETIDPYNSYLLGRFGLKSFLKNGYDIYKVPFIKEISNRYLLSKHVDLMMKKPNRFDEFCDTENFDHFSLFVLYPLQDELQFRGEFNCVSFWVRFEHTANKGINYFFNDGNVYLSFDEDKISIEILSQRSDKMFINTNSDKMSQTVTVKVDKKWIHFYIISEDERRTVKKTVFVNGKSQISCNVQHETNNNSVFLYNYGQKLMYIGTAIRFFSRQSFGSNFAQNVFKNGPGDINFISNKREPSKSKNLISTEIHLMGEFIITPFNLSRKSTEIWKEVPPNCYTVPYFGFPFHFLSNQRLSDLFKILNSSNDEDSFNFIFRTLLSINSIITLNPDRFFRQFLNSMTSNRPFISKQIFIKTHRSIFGRQPPNIVLQSILFDRDMWEKIDPNLLLEVFFDDYFNSTDFSKIPEYELFLLLIVHKHPECIETLMKNIQKVPNINKLLLDTLKYQKKKNVRIQLEIASNYAKIIQSSSFLNESVIFKQIREFLATSVKPLASEIFNLMTVISIKKRESFPMTNSILYSVMQLVSFKTVWQNVYDLNEAFEKSYISLLLGLIWSYSYGEIFLSTFNDKVFNRSNSYDTRHISYLKENSGHIINDKFCLFLLLNFFPILYNVTEFEIGGLKSDQMSSFTRSILESFDFVVPKYYTYKPEVTKKYFKDSSLIFLYNTILKECKNESKFKSIYFALFVGAPFYNVSMYSEYSPIILTSFLSNYTPFPNCQLFLKYLMFTVSLTIQVDQLENILILLFDTCEAKHFNTMNVLLFCIFNEYSENEIIFEILKGHIGTFYNIITSQKSELAWFSLLMNKKDILNTLKQFEWPLATKNTLNAILSPSEKVTDFELSEMKEKKQALARLYHNEIESMKKEFVNNKYLFRKNEAVFFKEVMNQIEPSQKNSIKIHESIKNKKSILSNSIEFVEEKMHWSHFITSLTDRMSDVTQFQLKSSYLSQKAMPYNCPQLFTPLIFDSKDETMKLFTEVVNDTKKHDKVKVDLFMRSESLPESVVIVECKLCRYKYEIPSVMFFYKSGICFLTYAELSTENEIKLIDKTNYDFIMAVLTGQWGHQPSIFSRHIVIKMMVDDIIFIQFIKYKAFNIWSFKQGQFMVKIDSGKLKQIKYSLSLIIAKAMDNFSPYPFLFKIEDYSAAFNKWSKYEISTDDLLLASNGLSRRSFANLKTYPYFPFIFADINNSSSSNISLLEDSQNNVSISSGFLFKSNLSLTPSSSSNTFISQSGSSQFFLTNDQTQGLYSIPSSSNETTTLLRNALPFSKMASSDFSAINNQSDLNPPQDIPKAESASDLQNSASYGNDIANSCQLAETSNNNSEMNRSYSGLNSPIKPDEDSSLIFSSDIIQLGNLSNQELSDSSGEEFSYSGAFNSSGSSQIVLESIPKEQASQPKQKTTINTTNTSNIDVKGRSDNNKSDSNLVPKPTKITNSGFFASFFSKAENKANCNNEAENKDNSDDRINRTRLTSFSSTNTSGIPSLGISIRKRIKRFSDAPSNFFQKPMNVPNQSSILVDSKRATSEQLDSIIRMFAEPLLQSYIDRQTNDTTEKVNLKEEVEINRNNAYRFICPANFFYSPEMIKNISQNPAFCVQRHRESLENANNAQFIAGWIIEHIIGDACTSKMRRIISQRSNQFINAVHIFSLNLVHMSQKLKKGCKPSKTFIFTSDNKLKRIKRLSKRIFDSYFAVIDKKDLSLSIIDFSSNMKKKAKTILCYRDKFFALSKSICVSMNGLFMSIDYEFGVTRVYRILYSKGIPCSIDFISDFSSKMSPYSVIDGNRWICATASASQLVLWNIFDGTIHRVLNFGSSKITAISMDEESGIWVATENKGYFISINGEILSELDIREEISQINAISIHSSRSDRAAACGTVSGRVFLLTPRFDTKTIDTKELKGGHSHEIMQIIVNKNLKMFITVDSKNNSVLWTAKGLSCENMNISIFDKCSLCNQKPELCCSSCNRPICKKCSIHGLCLTCYSLN